MRATGLDVFDTALHKTNTWLNGPMSILGWPDKPRTHPALRATLHALRDRLTVEEVAQLGAQLPMLIRGFYDEDWDPGAKPSKVRQRERFLVCITQRLRHDDDIDPERVARAVFTLLAERVSEGEIEDVKHVLPAEIRDLWP